MSKTQEMPFPKVRTIASSCLAVIGLAGLADGVVEWRDFFEVGVMVHYRELKTLLLDLVPMEIWSWVPDYLVIGSAVATSKSSVGIKYRGYSKSEDRYRQLRVKYGALPKLFFNFIFLPIWPLYFVYMYKNYISDIQKCDQQIHILRNSEFVNEEGLKALKMRVKTMKEDLWKAYRSIFLGFCTFLFYFLIAVFVLSDLSKSLF